MTILALNKMYVVCATRRFERCVHGFNVEPAVRQARVTLGAGGSCALIMSGVAGQATQALMHSHARAIIAGTGLESVIGRMALVAWRLTHIGRDANPPCSSDNLGKRQHLCAEMHLFAAIIETQRRAVGDRLRGLLTRRAHAHGRTRAMHGVAGRTGNRRLIRFDGLRRQMPGSFEPDGLDKLMDAVLEIHPMALQTVIAQDPALVVVFVEENLPERCVVRPGSPGGVLLLVALAAARVHPSTDVALPQQEPFGNAPANVMPKLSHVVKMKPGVSRKNAAMAFLAFDGAMGGYHPAIVSGLDLMTSCAGFAASGGVIDAPRRDSQKNKNNRRNRQQPEFSTVPSGVH